MATDWLADVRKYAPDADEAVVGKIVRYLGIALRNRDSSLVSFSDAAETGRVRGNFLKKKLGLTQSDEVLDAAIAAVGKRMKGDRTKNRVTVYYLLADHFGALGVFGAVQGAAKASAPAKKTAAPKKPAAAKATTPAAKATAAPAATAKAPKATTTKTVAPKAVAPKAVAAKTATAKATTPKAAAAKATPAAKPKVAKATAPKATAAKATLVSPVTEAASAPPPPPPPAPPPPPPPPTPAPPVAPDAGASGVLAAANLGDGDAKISTGSAGGSGNAAPPPKGGSSTWWIWVLAALVLGAIYFFFMQSRHEPKPGWDANLSADFNTTSAPATDEAGLDNAVDNALTTDPAPAPEASPPTQ